MKTVKIAVLSLVMLSGYSFAESTSLSTVKEYMAAWNAHDASRAAQYLAEDAVYYDAAAGEP
ncbi:nuclear transport factor 2 family protein, partial [Citrobacter freundii]